MKLPARQLLPGLPRRAAGVAVRPGHGERRVSCGSCARVKHWKTGVAGSDGVKNAEVIRCEFGCTLVQRGTALQVRVSAKPRTETK